MILALTLSASHLTTPAHAQFGVKVKGPQIKGVQIKAPQIYGSSITGPQIKGAQIKPGSAQPTRTLSQALRQHSPTPQTQAVCGSLPNHTKLKAALSKARKENNGGLNLDMWGTVVDRAGRVCAIAYTGQHAGSQWLGSRLISAQKANTANAFSLDGLALSTANLFSPTQPGGSLFGLQASNPINVPVAYNRRGNLYNFGTLNDPLVGELIGGTNVFGGGLALYNNSGKIVGALGVSGDTSCADHNIAWRTRHTLAFDVVSGGVSSAKNDQIIYDIVNGKSTGGFGHPVCSIKSQTISKSLPLSRTVNAPNK